MAGSNDLKLRAPAGTTIKCYPPTPALGDPRYTIVINNPAGSPQQFVLAYAPGVGDGATSQRYGNLTGFAAITGFNSFSYPTQLTGLGATTAAGVLQNIFFLDNFTSGNLTTPTHTVDVPGGGHAWNLAVAPTVGSFPAISSARLVPNDSADYWIIDTNSFVVGPYPNSGANGAGDYYVETSMRYAGNNGAPLLAAIVNAGGTGNGWYFGWNDSALCWELGDWSLSGSMNVIAQEFSASIFSGTVGETKTLRLEAQGVQANGIGALTGTVHLQGYVDGVLVIDTSTATFGPMVWFGFVGIVGGNDGSIGLGHTHSCEIDWIDAGAITRTPTGLAATTAAGTVVGSTSGGGSISIAGEVATTAQGTIVPEVAALPLGRSATTAQGTVGTSTADVNVNLSGFAVTSAQGAMVPSVVAGASASGQTLNPVIEMTFVTRSFPANAGYLVLSQQPMSIGGVLRGTYDDVNVPNVSASRFDPGVQGSRRYVRADGSSDFVPSAAASLGDYNPAYRFNVAGGKYAPEGEEFDYEIAGGGCYTFDSDGAMHWLHSRAFAFKDEYNPSTGPLHFRPRFGDPVYIYQSDYNVEQGHRNGESIDHSLPRAFIRPTVYFDKNLEHPLALYAHSQHNVWLFYPDTYDPPVAITGRQLTTAAGTLTPSIPGQAQLVGASATTRQGTLKPTSTTGQNVVLTGAAITTSAGAVARFNPANILPAYVRGDGYAWDSAHTVQLSSISGGSPFVIKDMTTVVRSGYNDTIYLVYLSGSASDFYTPASIGVVVLNAVSGVVTSHTLTALTNSNVFAANLPRPLADVVKLSSGTSVTQFMLAGHIFHMTWNSGTYTAPTLTQKTAPSVPSGYSAFLPGCESFDVKGDEVFHTLFAYGETGSTTLTLHIKAIRNDATGTTSTYTVPSNETFSAVEPSGFTLGNGYCGGGEGLSTWMVQWWTNPLAPNPYPIGEGPPITSGLSASFDFPSQLPTGLYSSQGRGTQFNYRHWASQAPYFTVSAAGRVGTVTCTVVNGVSAALTGLGVTTSAGTLGAIATIGLVGQVATTAQGTIFFSTPGTGALQGLAATTARGVLVPTVTVALTGAVATSARGLIVPEIAVKLVGQVATSASGVLTASATNSIALTGLRATTAQGVLTASATNSSVFTGQVATTGRGTIVPEIAVGLAGARCTGATGQAGVIVSGVLLGGRLTASAGVLQILTQIFLTGRSATAVRGTVAIRADGTVNVSGVQASGVVGQATTNLPAIGPAQQLYTHKVDPPEFTHETDAELYNEVPPAG